MTARGVLSAGCAGRPWLASCLLPAGLSFHMGLRGSLPATDGRESCSSEAHARETHDRVMEWGTQGGPRKSCRTWMHGQQEGCWAQHRSIL